MSAVLILNAAYVALLASTFTRTLVWLRAMLELAAIAFIVSRGIRRGGLLGEMSFVSGEPIRF